MERRCINGVDFHEFALYIPMVQMVCIQNCVRCLPVHIMWVQGWVGIAATCWVSWWLGLRDGPISRKGSESPKLIGHQWSGSWKLSLPVLCSLPNSCVVALIGTEYLFPQNIVLGPLILHCSWCVALVLIPTFSNCHEFLVSHWVCRVLIYFWVVWLGYCLHISGMPSICSYSLCMIGLEISQ